MKRAILKTGAKGFLFFRDKADNFNLTLFQSDIYKTQIDLNLTLLTDGLNDPIPDGVDHIVPDFIVFPFRLWHVALQSLVETNTRHHFNNSFVQKECLNSIYYVLWSWDPSQINLIWFFICSRFDMPGELFK